MAKSTAAGATISIGTVFGAAKTMSAVSNAADAEATLEASHGILANDILHIVASGWKGIKDRVVRAGTVDTNDVTLPQVNTLNTSVYRAGKGAGSVRKVTDWEELGEIKFDTLSTSGGEQNYTDATALNATVGEELPTNVSPSRLMIDVMESSAGYEAAIAAQESKAITPVWVSNGDVDTYFAARISVVKMPQMSGNAVTTYRVMFAIVGEPMTYFNA